MVYIIKVHLDGGDGHEHISAVQWAKPGLVAPKESTAADMVRFIDDGGVVRVTDGANEVEVHVVDGTPRHMRTQADGRWTNNLLALPRY